jgi:hypothetical protein
MICSLRRVTLYYGSFVFRAIVCFGFVSTSSASSHSYSRLCYRGYTRKFAIASMKSRIASGIASSRPSGSRLTHVRGLGKFSSRTPSRCRLTHVRGFGKFALRRLSSRVSHKSDDERITWNKWIHRRQLETTVERVCLELV